MCHMRIYCAVAAGLHIEQFPICLTLLKHVSHVSLHYSHHSQSTYLHPRVSVRPVDSTSTLVSTLSRSPLVVYRILCSSQNRVRALDRALTEPAHASISHTVPGPGPGPGRCLPCRTRAELTTDPPQCYIHHVYNIYQCYYISPPPDILGSLESCLWAEGCSSGEQEGRTP